MKVSMTSAQAEVVEKLSAPAFMPPKINDDTLRVYDIQDDESITLYVIKPDGEYHTESLENGLGGGWTIRDMGGDEIEAP